jgi:diguanylate cyclase (GGDEF)-like protein
MKECVRNSAQHGEAGFSAVVRPGLTPKDSDHALARLQGALSELADLRQALAVSQRETLASRNVIRELEEINSHLSAEVARLEQKEAQARALAYYDELTGLPNRRLLQDRLRQAIAQCARQDTQLALLFADLDGFKGINDHLGHPVGDRLLQLLVAERLTTSIRAADTVCRYGGDEFVVMIPAVAPASLSASIAEKVRRRLAEPYIIDGFEIRITASIGAAFYPDHGQTCEELMKRADDALYRAKAGSATPSINALHSDASDVRSVERGRLPPLA